MTTKEAAKQTGRSVRTIRYYIAEGLIPVERKDGKKAYDIPQETVDALKKQLEELNKKEKEKQP